MLYRLHKIAHLYHYCSFPQLHSFAWHVCSKGVCVRSHWWHGHFKKRYHAFVARFETGATFLFKPTHHSSSFFPVSTHSEAGEGLKIHKETKILRKIEVK